MRRSRSAPATSGAGDYAVVRIGEGSSGVASRDPAALARAFAAILENDEVLQRFADEDLAPAIVSALRGTLRLRELRLAVDELRTMLDS